MNYNDTITISANSATTWLPTIVTNPLVPSNTWLMTNTTSTSNSTKVVIDIKRCRNCSHAHLAGQTGCIEQDGWNVIFIICSCKEYLPSDNLEYLEYLAKKKESY